MRLTQGKGYNSGGVHLPTINGKYTKGYTTWRSMLMRCYDPRHHAKQPTYIGCSVSDEWLDYQNFANWYYNNEHSDKGYHLDKDILVDGNKIYSSDTCCFVPKDINNLLTSRGNGRGKYPQGVCFHKAVGKYSAQMGGDVKVKHLGYFKTPDEAYKVYKEAKERHVKNTALKWANKIQWETFLALMRWELKL